MLTFRRMIEIQLMSKGLRKEDINNMSENEVMEYYIIIGEMERQQHEASEKK